MTLAMGRRWTDQLDLSARNLFVVSIFLFPPFACVALAAYWLIIDTDPPITYTTVSTFDINMRPATEFRRGDTMIVARNSCVRRDNELLTYTRRLVSKKNNTIYFMPADSYVFRKGCLSPSVNFITLPKFTEPGEYEYVVEVSYRNNPFVTGSLSLAIPKIVILE